MSISIYCIDHEINTSSPSYPSFGSRYESYLSHSDPVVLALNPFFVLE